MFIRKGASNLNELCSLVGICLSKNNKQNRQILPSFQGSQRLHLDFNIYVYILYVRKGPISGGFRSQSCHKLSQMLISKWLSQSENQAHGTRRRRRRQSWIFQNPYNVTLKAKQSHLRQHKAFNQN